MKELNRWMAAPLVVLLGMQATFAAGSNRGGLTSLSIGESVRVSIDKSELDLERTERGIRFTDQDGEARDVGADAIDRMKVDVLAKDDDQVVATVEIPGLGDRLERLLVSGQLTRDGRFVGDVTDASGNLAVEGVVVEPAITADGAQVIIVIGAAALSVLACFIIHVDSDCAGDCTSACSASGGSVSSYEAGICGRCTCNCRRNG